MASTIPVSDIVSVDIAVSPQFPQRAGFGTLCVVTNEIDVIGIAERVRYYSNISGVSADWAADTEAYKAAQTYFAQSPRPSQIAIAVRYDDAQAGQLRGGSVTDLQALRAIASGSFSVSLTSATAQEITGIDLSSSNTFEEMAAIIQTALRAPAADGFTSAICVYEGGRFIIDSGIPGGASTVSFATDASFGEPLADLLQIKQGQGTKTDGVDAETITSSLNAIAEKDDGWYGLMFTKEVRDSIVINTEDAVVAAANWCEARIKTFFNTTNDLDVLDSVTTNDICSVLRDASYNRTITTFSSYPDQYPSASASGKAFTVNFSQPNSTITMKFKQLPTVTVERLNVNQKLVLDGKRGNAIIDVGGNFMYAEGWVASGRFFDEIHGLDWLQNAIQTNVFGYVYTRATKVPYTNAGAAALEQQVRAALQEAVINGLLAPGYTLDGLYLPNGFEVYVSPVEAQNQSDIEARFYQGITFVAKGAGAIHKVAISGTFNR